MKKTMKSTMILAAILFLLLGTGGCGAPQAVSKDVAPGKSVSEEVVSASEHLLAVWYDYLDVLDKMYASELWALDYVDAYLESGDWNDLTKARTACIASARYLTELSMTEADLPEEEYGILSDAGIDTGYQTADFMSLAEDIDEAHGMIRERMLESLESEVFDRNLVEILREEVSVQRNYISSTCRYTANQTNYLLLTLEETVDSEAAWTFVQEAYPALFGEHGEWIAVEAELEALGEAYLDEYEEVVLQQAGLISRMEADLYRMTQIIQNNDVEALMEAACPMSHTPDLLPTPVWYNPTRAGYLSLIAAQDGSVVYPESGDQLEDVGYSMYIQVENVSAEDVTAYLAFAQNYAKQVWKSQDDDNTWYIEMPTYDVKMEWAENTATVLFHGADVTFAPVWYIGLR